MRRRPVAPADPSTAGENPDRVGRSVGETVGGGRRVVGGWGGWPAKRSVGDTCRCTMRCTPRRPRAPCHPQLVSERRHGHRPELLSRVVEGLVRTQSHPLSPHTGCPCNPPKCNREPRREPTIINMPAREREVWPTCRVVQHLGLGRSLGRSVGKGPTDRPRFFPN